MPRKDSKNLTIMIDDYVRLRRVFDSIDTKLDWIDWLIEIMGSMADRYGYIKKNYPNLRFIGNSGEGCVVEDLDKKKVIVVNMRKPQDTRYYSFVLLHPEFRIKP